MNLEPWPKECQDVPTLNCLETVFANILKISSALIVVTLFIMLVVGALQYLTSGGNPEKVKKAQGTLTYAFIGTILFVSAFLILTVINVLFLGGGTELFHLNLPP